VALVVDLAAAGNAQETTAINEYNQEFFFWNNDRNILASLLNFYVF